ncbi:Vegetative cell wall protein gp1 [Enhygromyxa salina]|uniref:Vegetative cell wall protein gp1 n=1 Tax=Enhygromyxa salina TaxID=215803 RepID=A0A0C2CT15_9BACT|nr:hypothetical protein [Enhygromyxa salina]KIG14301.1 Vegetative cell wall protein gp1 [Enhygromyxa salina]
MQANAKEILLLAAEDAFEFERWRDAGPVTADIDPETRAAEVAEFEALGIPLPSDLDSLRRELEHAPKVREAIRCSAVAMRRSGRASASSLVALGPQQLMPAGMGMPWGWPGGPMMDPRLDPRLAAQMGFVGGAAAGRGGGTNEDDEPRPRSKRERKLADATVVGADGGSIDAQVVGDYDLDDDDADLDDFDDPEDDELERARQREAERRRKKRRAEARKARAARAREWDDDEFDEDDGDDSMVAVAASGAVDRNTWILGGVSAVAVIALLWIAFGDKKDQGDPAAVDPAAQLAAQQEQQQPAPPAPPAPAAVPIDPNTGLPYGQVPAPVADAPGVASGGGGGGRGGGGRGSAVRGSGGSAPAPASGAGGGTAFGGFKDVPGPPGTEPAPAANGGTQPAANGGTQPAANGGTQAAANGGAVVPAPAPAPAPAPQPAADTPAEPPKPAPPEESLLTKSKMTPAIRQGVTQRVGDLLACLEDARVGKPDLAGNVVFTVSLDQDGVVTKVDIGKDEVGYGVAKCSAKKMRRWTLPSAGIPIIFDVPFAF